MWKVSSSELSVDLFLPFPVSLLLLLPHILPVSLCVSLPVRFFKLFLIALSVFLNSLLIYLVLFAFVFSFFLCLFLYQHSFGYHSIISSIISFSQLAFVPFPPSCCLPTLSQSSHLSLSFSIMESALHVEDVCFEITPSRRVVFRKGVDHLGVSVACLRLFKLFECKFLDRGTECFLRYLGYFV